MELMVRSECADKVNAMETACRGDLADALEAEPVSINLARVDLVSIRLAVLCAELGSLSAAARRAHCSLSTSSYRLTALEASLGSPLFTRDHRGLRTNNAGQLFVEHAKAILEHIDLMSSKIRSLG
ncbi:LysR family transcriptional regulator [Variovorax saccharolyticus]|uniref:LysR family transcriptional regulator n=1 Tax=Variovorax saccharolyticus TaxID=3053516 RepID=UPI00257824DC|nr:LysR family transcriptional regulator [Variovorax sp. J22R187]MDM0021778.1 LysR family transcriptional regulator [Variovorax sp. J22R187]